MTVELGQGAISAFAAASRAASIPALLAILAIAGAADDGQARRVDFFIHTVQGTVMVATGWEVIVIVGCALLAFWLIDLQVRQTGYS